MKINKSHNDAINKLDDINYINTVDNSRLLALIEMFPEQVECVTKTVLDKIFKKTNDYSAVGVIGVGTTRVCAEILKSFMNLTGKLPVYSLNDYSLPNWVDKSTLLFFVSFSGNTEEVISCFEQSLKRGCSSIVITTGGCLDQVAKKNNVTVFKLKRESPPNRTVLPYMIVPLMMICSQMGFLSVKQDNFRRTAEFLREKRSYFSPENETKLNLPKQVALHCFGSIPLIYTDNALYTGVLLRWRYQFNENAKMLAYTSILPEMSHNEIIGIEGSRMSHIVAPIFLGMEGKENPVSGRTSFTQKVIKESGYNLLKIPLLGENELERVFYGIYLGDYISFYLAILRGVDPHAVDLIDRIRLSENKGPV